MKRILTSLFLLVLLSTIFIGTKHHSLYVYASEMSEHNQLKTTLEELYLEIKEKYPEYNDEQIKQQMYQEISNNFTSSTTTSDDDYEYDYGNGTGSDSEWMVILKYLSIDELFTLYNLVDRVEAEEIKNYSNIEIGNWQTDRDAFRHTYLSAMLTYEFGEEFAKALTDAHEADTIDELDKEMDLHNNARGIDLEKVWKEKYMKSTSTAWDELSSFITHCVKYGGVYNIVRIEANDNGVKRLLYTTEGIDNLSLFPLPYDEAIVNQEEYGYEGQYFFYEKKLTVSNSHITFETKRLRTGFIENEYIVLSPRRENAGVAYLEYELERPIKELSVELTLWSSTEILTMTTSSARLEYMDEDGNWTVLLDLLNDIKLSIDRTLPNFYRIVFPDNVTKFRYYVSSEATGDRNKGRICIGETRMYLEPKQEHVHTYTYAYTPIDSTSHLATCDCGEVATQSHIVKSSDLGNRYVNCMLCGYLLDLSKDIVIVAPDSVLTVKKSANGSYILSNGIVVLVDNDIDEYLNGTLYFYDKDNELV